MVFKEKERIMAVKLRREGKTYSEILREIKVSKSSLSLWLREVGLAKAQKQRITAKRIAGRLKAIQAIRNNKIARIKTIKNTARMEVVKLIKDPFWLVGLILYWCEGSKEHANACSVKFTNMDLSMHKIFLVWIKRYLAVSSSDVYFELFIHEKADIVRAKRYWAKNLNFPDNRLKVYFKRHNPKTKRKRVGNDYFGVLSIIARKSIPLNRRIAGWVEGVVVLLGS